jgi:hypothetical protein
VPAPTAAVFEGAATRPERVARLAAALFDYYERIPALLRCGAINRRRVARTVRSEEADNRLTLAARAIGAQKRGGKRINGRSTGRLDVYRALRRRASNTATAAGKIAALVDSWLDHAEH